MKLCHFDQPNAVTPQHLPSPVLAATAGVAIKKLFGEIVGDITGVVASLTDVRTGRNRVKQPPKSFPR